MYMYLFIICLLIFAIIINIKIYNFDILSVSFLYNCSMLISVICSTIGLLTWNDVNSLSFPTALIIIISILFFNFGEFIARRIFKPNDIKKNKAKRLLITPSRFFSLIALLFAIITFFCILYEVIRISRIVGYNGNNIFNIIKSYRSTSILFSTDYIKKGIHINIIIAQMQKAIEVVCYVFIYIIISNVIYKKFYLNVEYIFSIMIVVVCILASLLIGSRMQLFIYILYSFFIVLILLGKKYSYKYLIIKYWKRLLLIGLSCIALFYCILPLTGRNSKSNPIDYTTFYFGAPIPTLNKYMDEHISKPNFFGEETFRGIQNVAYKLHLSNYIQPITTKWIAFYTKNNVKMQSNIYTSSKRYYHDFGYLGVVVLQFINGFVFSLLYIIMKKKNTNLSIVFYAMYLYMVIDQVRDEYLFSTFVHINTIFKFAVLYCLLYFLEHDTKEVKSIFIRIKNKFEVTKNENKDR